MNCEEVSGGSPSLWGPQLSFSIRCGSSEPGNSRDAGATAGLSLKHVQFWASMLQSDGTAVGDGGAPRPVGGRDLTPKAQGSCCQASRPALAQPGALPDACRRARRGARRARRRAELPSGRGRRRRSWTPGRGGGRGSGWRCCSSPSPSPTPSPTTRSSATRSPTPCPGRPTPTALSGGPRCRRSRPNNPVN